MRQLLRPCPCRAASRRVATILPSILLCWLGMVAQPAQADDSLLAALSSRDYTRAFELVSGGADPNAADVNGRTPLMIAGRSGRSDLVAALIDAGADVNAANNNGGTPLMFSAIAGDPATVSLLLEHGARVQAVGNMGWTALMVAAVKGHPHVIHMLLEGGADPNHPDVYGWTALMRAANRDRLDAVTALMADARTELERRDDDGGTALHHAAEEGHERVVDYLRSRGANVSARDNRGFSAADRARLAGHVALADRLGGGAGKD